MRRERTRSARLMLAFGVGTLGVILWHLTTATAAPGSMDSPELLPTDSRDLPAPQASFTPAVVLGAPVVEVSANRFVTRAAVLGQEPSSRDTFTSSAEPPAPPPPVMLLPLASGERAPDGLPALGMRCTRTGGGLECGACRTDGDCPAGQGCVANRTTRRFECMASECEEDVHCQPGSVCRSVTTGATGSIIRRCMPEGLRRDGEPCDTLPVSPAGSCREGLRCVNQVCSLPCSLEGGAHCAPGFFCTDSLDGPGCFPDCQRLGCPDGQHCARVRDDEYQCLVDSQGDCRETPCPEGERCNLRMSRGRAVFWCARVCNPLRDDSCGTGEVCGVGSPTVSTCFRKCDPMDGNACGAGWSCSTVTEDMSVFGCSPELSH